MARGLCEVNGGQRRFCLSVLVPLAAQMIQGGLHSLATIKLLSQLSQNVGACVLLTASALFDYLTDSLLTAQTLLCGALDNSHWQRGTARGPDRACAMGRVREGSPCRR